MITLIWKELRENAKWALLAMLILGGTEIYTLYPKDYQEENYGSFTGGSTLLRTPFLTVTTFGCAGVGFILGLIQILPELRRDRWAALLHRPASRGTIFRGKAIAGLILYAIATVPPFLLAVWWTATPGHFSTPFLPELALAGTVDTCMGAAYYFAALATGLQGGGWLILRACPLLAAIHTTYFVANSPYFYVAMEAAVLMALLLFTAAWGEILNPDWVNKRPLLGKLAFFAMIFYGVCGAGELVNSFAVSLVPQPNRTYQNYQLTDSGVPVSIISSQDGAILSVLDVNGKPLADPKYQPEKIRNHLKYLNGCSEYVGESHGYKPQQYTSGYRDQRSYYWGDYPVGYPRLQRWFHLEKGRYYLGIYPDKKQPFAILDQDGFKPATATPVPMAPDVQIGYAGQGSTLLWTPHSARYVFFEDQKIVDVQMPAPTPIYGEGHAFASHGQVSVATAVFVLGSGVAIFDDKANPITFIPYNHDVSKWGQLDVGINGTLDRFYIWYKPSGFLQTRKDWYHPPGVPSDDPSASMPSFVDETDAQGRVLHTYTLPPVRSDPKRPRTWVIFLGHRLQTPAFFFGNLLYMKIGGMLGSDRLKGSLAWTTGSIWSHDDTLGNMIWLPPIYAILGLLALAMARRVYYSWPRAWAWAVFVAAFGVPGFVVFRLASDWPCLVRCPSCGRPRPVDWINCPVCNAVWPRPDSTGLEIFDTPRRGTATAANV